LYIIRYLFFNVQVRTCIRQLSDTSFNRNAMMYLARKCLMSNTKPYLSPTALVQKSARTKTRKCRNLKKDRLDISKSILIRIWYTKL